MMRQETLRDVNHRFQGQSTARPPPKTKAGTTDRGLNPRISAISATEETRAMIKTDNTINALQPIMYTQVQCKSGGIVN